uniref:LAGLIDADG homing endonuclease n=1 Tax=Termitomyces sp. TaxID=1916073 RepID=A0A386TYR8_9AGAR|nr:LAGLIDADG homing endonuclease [Termitomyces sp.]
MPPLKVRRDSLPLHTANLCPLSYDSFGFADLLPKDNRGRGDLKRGIGRLKGPVKKSIVDRSKYTLYHSIKEIMVGLMQGDGHIQQRKNSRFIYAQSSLRIHHLNYFKHVLSLFKPYLSEEFVLKNRNFRDKRTNKTYSSVSFATLTLPCFNHYRSLFYDSNNKKIVPSTIQNLLTPIGLAYWIMDDGSIQNSGLHLNTYGFTSSDVIKLKTVIENLFVLNGEKPLKCSIHKHKKGDRIYICPWPDQGEGERKYGFVKKTYISIYA